MPRRRIEERTAIREIIGEALREGYSVDCIVANFGDLFSERQIRRIYDRIASTGRVRRTDWRR